MSKKKKRLIINTEIDPMYLGNFEDFMKALERELEFIREDAIAFYKKEFQNEQED